MRRGTFAGVMAFVLAAVLSGCSAPKTAAEAELPAESEREPEAETCSVPQISFERAEKDWWNEEHSVWLLHAEYDRVSLEEGGSQALAEALASWSDNRERDVLSCGEESAACAMEDPAFGEADPGTYFFSIYQKTELMRADSQVVSLLEMTGAYLGGAHGNYEYEGATFETGTGKKLELSDILQDPEAFQREAVVWITDRLKETYGDMLFPDYARTVERMWSDNPSWYLDAGGLTFVFDPYEVGPFSMGKTSVTLPYMEFDVYMKPEYGKPPKDGRAVLPENVTLSLEDDFRLNVYHMDEDSWVKIDLSVDDMVYEVGEFGRLSEAYLLTLEDGRRFVLLDADEASDDFVTFLYEFAEGGLRERSRLEGVRLRDGSFRRECMTLYKHVNVLGSYDAKMDYRITEEGTLEQIGNIYVIPENPVYRKVLTAVREVPAAVGEEETALPAGSRIRITGTDDEDTAYFVNEDTGEEGSISFVRGNGKEDHWSIFIDGIQDTEYFDMVPYAG